VSVWLDTPSSEPVLNGAEGTLISVNITVQPQDLEDLLDALAQLEHPINPQIYHQALVVFRRRDGREESQSTTIVDFPAYPVWVEDIRRILGVYGFDPESVYVSEMLAELHADSEFRRMPGNSPYAAVRLIKSAPLIACA
jgi:hypothetical protein